MEGAASLHIAAATALEQRVAETASGRGFDKAIDDFARLLGTVPDSGRWHRHHLAGAVPSVRDVV